MKTLIKRGWYVVLAAILFIGAAQPARAQFTSSDLETGLFYSAMAKDAAKNIYVIQVEPGTSGTQGEVVKYTAGAGTGTVIYAGFHEGDDTGPGGDLPWGLAVTSNGDVYMTTDFSSLGGAIIKLAFDSGTNIYTPSTFLEGSYYTALTVDKNDNLYTTQYDPTGNGGSGSYAVYRYTPGGTGTLLYDNLKQLAGYSYPTGLAVDANLNVYVTDAYNEDGTVNDGGHVYELAASAYTTPITVSTGNYATSLAVDASGNLYSTENTGTNNAGYKLLKYTHGSGTPAVLYSPLHTDGIYYPWGIAVVSGTDIFVNDADDISGDGLGAADGAVVQLIGAPTSQARNVTFSNTNGTSTTATWTNGNGSARAVFIAQASTGSPVPVNATAYTANPAFGSGTQIGVSGWYCVYNGAGTTVNITGLTTGDTYRVMAVEYNGTGNGANYLTTVATNNPNNVTATATTAINSIALVASSPTNAATVQYTATFGSSVAGLTTSNFSLTTTGSTTAASVASVTGTGPAYTVTVNTGTGSGTIGLNLANASGLTPGIGTALPFQGGVYTIDKTDPVPLNGSFTSNNANPGFATTGNIITASFTASEPIQIPVMSIAGHPVTFSNPGNDQVTWIATYTMTASDTEGDIAFSLLLTDLAGNESNGGVPFTDVNTTTYVVFDKTAPTVTIGSPSATSATTGPVTYSVTYADANFESSSLTTSNISLNTSSAANGAISLSGSGTAYVVTISGISGTGNLGISIAAGTAVDAAGNPALSAGPSATFTVAPAVGASINSITTSGTSPTNAAAVQYTVTFGSAITGLSAGDFSITTTGSITGAGVTSITPVSSTIYTVTVSSGTGDGTIRLNLANATGISPGISTTLPFTGQACTIQKSPPSLTSLLYTPFSGYVNVGGVVTLTFGTNVTIQTPVVTIAGHSITATNTGGNNYSASYTMTAGDVEGRVDFTLLVTDLAGNQATFTDLAAGDYIFFDKTPPTLTIGSPSVASTSTGPVTYSVTYADANFGSSSLTTANISLNTVGTAAGTVSVSGSGTAYTVTISAITGTGNLGFSIAAGTGSDKAGNLAPAAVSTTFAVALPGITINAITATGPTLTNAASVQYSVTFGSPIKGFTAGNFSLTTTGSVSGASVTSVTAVSATIYTVTVNTGTGDGTIGLNLANAMGLSTAISTSLPFAGQTYTIDKTPPSETGYFFLSSNAFSNEMARLGDIVELTFNVSETVQTPVVTIAGHNIIPTSIAVNRWSATYQMQSADAEGIIPFTVSLTDLAGNTNTNFNSAEANSTLVFDETRPSITIGNPSTSSTSTGPVSYSVTYADANFNSSSLATANISLNTLGTAVGTVSLSGSGTAYVVTVSGISGTGNLGISIAAGTALDQAGNAALAAGPSATFAVAPVATTSITGITPTGSSPTNAPSVQYSVTFGSPIKGFTAGNFSLTATGSVSGASVTSVTAVSATNYTVTVNTGTGDGTIALNLANATGLSTGISTSLPFAGQSYTIDKTLPSAPSYSYTSNNAFSPGMAKTGDIVTLTFSVSEAVQTPVVTIAGHSVTPISTGTNVWSANYQMIASDAAGPIPFAVILTDLAGNTNSTFTSAGVSTSIIFDKTPPTVTIGNPSVSSIITGGGPITYTITYFDANFNSSTLTPANVTLNTTGNATGVIGVTGAGTTFTVTISDITGSGSIGISIQAGTATDVAGNVAPPAGPSAIFAVDLISQHITFNPLPTKTYGDAGFSPGATSDNNGIPITYSSDNTAVATIVGGNIHIIGAGTANITASQAGDATHTPASNAIQQLKVNQAALTVTADNQSSTYGQAIPALTVAYSGFVNGDTEASLTTAATASSPATAASPAGSYTIKPSGAVDNNYAITYVNGKLTIGQAALTITADNQSSTYGQAIPALTVAYSGFVNGDTQASLTLAATASSPATAASPAGSYTIKPSGAVDNNYAITYVNGKLTIGQAALTVTADNQSSTYGQAIPALTVAYSGFVNGDTQASLTLAATASSPATAASPAGSYTIKPSGAVDNNYAITYVNGKLTIGQAALTVTADNQSSTYGQAIPALTVAYSGFVNGDTEASLTTAATASSPATAASPAGSYTIKPSGAVDNNYAITYVNGKLTIGQAALTVTADNQSSTYGQAIPALTVAYSGFVNGDTEASLTTAATASSPATAASPAGSYTIKPSGAVDNNYAITYVNGKLTIGQAALTVTADNQSSTYGQAIPALTVAYSGFVNGDTEASLTTEATASSPATAASPAGSYTIKPSGAVDNNYAITYVNGKLTIGQAALTVTADNQSSTYGQAIPALTVAYSGFVNGDTEASLTTAATASSPATAASPAGSYTIKPSGAVDNNYAITYVNGKLTIGQAALTVTADNQSSTYGQAIPALTVAYSGFVNGDTEASLTTAATASSPATAASPAGSYTIKPSGAVDNNYAITYVNGKLTIGQAALTITADNQSSTYGQAIPALTVAYSGFVNGDTEASLTTAATASSPATAASPAGSYTIKPSGAVDNNYAITYVNGKLTIGQAALTVTADNQSSTYGQAIPALTVAYSGFVNGDTEASLTTAATASSPATAASPAGSYTIKPSGAVDNNYAITYVNGKLTIGQAALTVTADNQSSTYGQVIPALTVAYSGFVNGDTEASLTTAATASSPATAASPAGSYTIKPSGAVDNNYAITYVNGKLTIGQAALTITADNQSSTYGQAIPALTVAYSGFVNGDTEASLTTAATASSPATAASPAGSYTIKPSGAVDNNYAITYVNGKLTIGQAALTVTADNQSSTYGQAIPALTVAYSGFVNGDTEASLTTAATASSPATVASPAGSYTIKPSGAVGNNYAITYVNGTLTIGQATLTITANNQSSVYGSPIPALTASFSGFVNGDNSASLTTQPTLATTAITTSDVGTYPITSGSAVDANYTIVYVDGTLTITQATRTLTFNVISTKKYGDPDFSPVAAASDKEAINYVSSNTAVATIVNGLIHITGVGSTTITASLTANNNYTTNPAASHQLVVDKGDQTISLVTIPSLLKGTQFDLSVISATSGLPVTFTVADPTVASVLGQTLSAIDIGTTTFTISQAGNDDYLPAKTEVETIDVNDSAGDDILVHQAVSPNGDGINDFLYIEGIDRYKDNAVSLVNRNGVLIFQAFNYDNKNHVFEGRSNITGALQEPGTYFYRVDFYVNGQRKSKVGFFVLKYD